MLTDIILRRMHIIIGRGLNTVRKFITILMLLLFILPICATAENETYSPLPLGGAAPYAPVAEAFSADGMNYDDGTMTVHIEQGVAYDTNIYYVYVTITDPSQIRTALAGPYPSKMTRSVDVLAEQNNAVLAINGDYFAYHSRGYVVRGGQVLRNNPTSGRDTLIIDESGDMSILMSPSAQSVAAFPNEIREAFSFGPGLIVDGAVQEFNYKEKTSCGYPTKAQRIAICQMDTLSYLIVVTEGPEQENQAGLSIPELTELLVSKNVPLAYNLDGGSSCTIMFGGKKINASESKLRAVGDIIYFATLRAQ